MTRDEPALPDLEPLAADRRSGVTQFRIAYCPGEASAPTIAALLDRTASMVREIGRADGDVSITAMSFEQDSHFASAECSLTVFFDEVG